MAKEFDIFLNRQPDKDIYIKNKTSEDIYLNKRLTECDIIVYSMPFREGLTTVDRLVLEGLVERYTLQKLLTIQSGSEVVQHIDKMLKTCYERLNMQTSLSADALIQMHHTPELSLLNMTIGAEVIDNIAETYEQIPNAIIIRANPTTLSVEKMAGEGTSLIEPTAYILGTIKSGSLAPSSNLTFIGEINDTEKYAMLNVNNDIYPAAELTNLCSQQYRDASASVAIVANVSQAEISIPLGSGDNIIYIDGSVIDEIANKYEAFKNSVKSLIEMTETITQFVAPFDESITMSVQATPIIRRYSLLSEVDGQTLNSFDPQALEDVDYIII